VLQTPESSNLTDGTPPCKCLDRHGRASPFVAAATSLRVKDDGVAVLVVVLATGRCHRLINGLIGAGVGATASLGVNDERALAVVVSATFRYSLSRSESQHKTVRLQFQLFAVHGKPPQVQSCRVNDLKQKKLCLAVMVFSIQVRSRAIGGRGFRLQAACGYSFPSAQLSLGDKCPYFVQHDPIPMHVLLFAKVYSYADLCIEYTRKNLGF